MASYAELISRALSGDRSALGALYTGTVATVYYSSLRITGSAYTAHLVTVRTYLLGFANLARVQYPAVFPIWLDRLSVYLACSAARLNCTEAELDAAKPRLIAFLRGFHRMGDAEIAALLSIDEQTVAGCASAPVTPGIEEFLMGRDVVAGIWNDVCLRRFTPFPGETPPRPAAAPAPTAAQAAPAATGAAEAAAAGAGEAGESEAADTRPAQSEESEPAAPKRTDLTQSEEYQKKQGRRRMLRIGGVALILALLGSAIYAGLHAKSADTRRTQREVSQLANTLSLQLSGQVGEIYPLGDDMYFVSINLGYGSVEGLVVQYELAENSIRVRSPDDAGVTEAELQKLTGNRYMQVLYNPTVTGSGRIKAGSTDARPGEEPLPEPTETPAPTKTPIIADGAEQDYELIRNEQDFSILLRINCRNVDFARPMTVILDAAIMDAIGEAGGLQIMLNDEAHTITLSNEQLAALCAAYGSVTLRLTARSERQYEISFFTETGDKLPELDSSMTFTLPASGPMTYVFAVYDSGTESRGGVYDAALETITFPVARSGLYELLGRETALRDADAMDAETAEAAYFLCSLEFMFPDEEGRFRPEGTITRNEAAAIIGRMFLATDPALQSEYSDVDLTDPAYDYISYGTASQIFTGWSDGTFRGVAEITREDLLTVLGRTLLYRRGEEAPDADAPLGFTDEAELVDYARGAVAALLESGILSPGGELRPLASATRGEAAVLLYRMYCTLYGYNGK